MEKNCKQSTCESTSVQKSNLHTVVTPYYKNMPTRKTGKYHCSLRIPLKKKLKGLLEMLAWLLWCFFCSNRGASGIWTSPLARPPGLKKVANLQVIIGWTSGPSYPCRKSLHKSYSSWVFMGYIRIYVIIPIFSPIALGYLWVIIHFLSFKFYAYVSFLRSVWPNGSPKKEEKNTFRVDSVSRLIVWYCWWLKSQTTTWDGAETL